MTSTMQQNPQVIGVEKDDAYQEEDVTFPRQHASDLNHFVEFMDGGYRCVYFIGQTNLKNKELLRFAEAIGRSPGIEDLFIWDNQLGNNGIKVLKEALSLNTSISKLFIAKNDITADGAQHIAKILEENTSLTHLSLKLNKLENKGIEIVAQALANNTSLKILDLTQTGVKDDGMKSLATHLKENLGLKELILYHNDITDVGAAHLGQLLKDNEGLLKIDLQDNKITDRGMGSIAEGIADNKILSEIKFDKNNFGDAGLDSILDALKTNETITRMQFGTKAELNADKQKQILDKMKANEEKQRDAYLKRLNGTTRAPWKRSKLMVVGEGGAGKTATVRSLLHKKFDENWDSTVGVAITETNAQNGWTADGKNGFAQTIAQRLAVLAQEEDREKQKEAKKRRDKKKNKKGGDAPKITLDDDEEGSSDNKEEEETKEQVEEVVVEKPKPKKQVTPIQSNIEDNINLDEISNEPLSTMYPFDATMVAKGRDEGEGVRMSIWDYGGQDVFYTLHHLFLTKYGVYLIVFDQLKILSQEEGPTKFLKFWLNSIKFHAKEAPILMVGTFLDKLENPKDVEKVDKIIRDMTKGFGQVIKNDKHESDLCYFPINNKEAKGIQELREMIESVTADQEFVDLEVSIQWMRALDIVLELKESWVSLSTMKAIGNKVGIKSATEVEEMLHLFHELGVILHFTATVNLADVVTTKPQWLIDSVSRVIRDSKLHPYDKKQFKTAGLDTDLDSLFKHGFASRDLLDFLWPKGQVDFLLDLMRKLLLLSNWQFGKEENRYLIPSMVPENGIGETTGTTAQFKFEFLPMGVFERLVCLAVDYSSSQEDTPEPKLGKKASEVYITSDATITLKVLEDDNQINVTVGNNEEAPKVLDIFQAMMRKLDQDVMNGSMKPKISLQNLAGDFMGIDEARKAKTEPWFKAEKQEVATDANFDNFLEKF